MNTKKSTVKNRIKRSVASRKADFFLTRDFLHLGSRRAVASALRSLVAEGFLIRGSIGVYLKTEWNKYSQKRVAIMPLSALAPMALERMGHPVRLGKLAQAYADGKITQIPNKNIYEIGNQNISRKFSLYGRKVYYERHGKLIKERGN